MKILTFDIEDWFHLLNENSTKTESQWLRFTPRIHENVDRILQLLADTHQPATFFCLGWVARKYPEIIKQIDDLGYEIATHSDLHQLNYELTKPQFDEDLKRSIHSLEDVTGKKVTAYRAPGFSLTTDVKWVFDSLIEQGITVDCSIFPANHSHGGFPMFGEAKPCTIATNGQTIKEFPINLYPFLGKKIVFSGGGYFRLAPLSIIDYCTANSDYVMTYFHPRDFDPNQPMIEGLNAWRRFKSYYGLKTCYSKLEFILKKYAFTDLRTAEKAVDWSKAPEIKI